MDILWFKWLRTQHVQIQPGHREHMGHERDPLTHGRLQHHQPPIDKAHSVQPHPVRYRHTHIPQQCSIQWQPQLHIHHPSQAQNCTNHQRQTVSETNSKQDTFTCISVYACVSVCVDTCAMYIQVTTLFTQSPQSHNPTAGQQTHNSSLFPQ